MELLLKINGILLMILAIAHGIFPRCFKWKEELQSASLINQQIMYVHTFFIAFTIFLMGSICFFFSNDLLTTKLGNRLLLGLFIFWTFRLLFQFFVFSPALWKGKKFETLMHALFSLLWIYLSAAFFLVYHQSN